MADSQCLVLRFSPSLARCHSQSHGFPPQDQLLIQLFLSFKEHAKKDGVTGSSTLILKDILQHFYVIHSNRSCASLTLHQAASSFTDSVLSTSSYLVICWTLQIFKL